jgi:Zn-finger nucleic acid-binding protein
MELAEVEVDFCIGCKGAWLDTGELEIMLDDDGKAQKLMSSFSKDMTSGEKPRQCPICDKNMDKVDVGNEKPTLLIDMCPKGDGLWFDSGELNEIIDRAKLDDSNKIKKVLSDMFGRK